jgi:hypothetical protein
VTALLATSAPRMRYLWAEPDSHLIRAGQPFFCLPADTVFGGLGLTFSASQLL